MREPVLPASAGAAANVAGADELGPLPEWDLRDLYSGLDTPEIARDLRWVERECSAFEAAHRGRLATIAAADDAGAGLLAAVRRFEALDEGIGKLLAFASLLYAGNTVDPARAKFYGDIKERVTTASAQLVFFTLELNRIDDAVLDRALGGRELARYRPWFDDIRRERPYQLEDRVEQLFHEKSVTGFTAWNRLFDETIASLKFTVDGQSLGIEPTLNLLQHEAEERRRTAALALAETFAANLRLFTLIINTLAKDKEISDRWRGFADVAASRHLANRVEPEIVEALTAAVRGAFPRLSHRYYALKAKWFGKAQLDYWDRNAPLPKVASRPMAWSEAKTTVLAAYRRFSPRMAAIAETFFAKNWIDAPVRPGKAPGAFSHPTVPSVHPYVLLNYMGKPRDVMTLAHELGHGVHQVLAAGNGPLLAPTPLTLAETASVFGEMLTFKTLLEKTTDATERWAMLAAKVEDMINTVVRQIAFYGFERKVHLERRNGELTAERLSQIWLEVQGESLGPAIKLGPGYETFWTYISHFIHAPFYVYAYAFGECLVNSLYALYERSASGFAERYLEMLAAGGTKHHEELLKPFGLNAREADFWNDGLALIERLIDELEELEPAHSKAAARLHAGK